MSVYVDDMNAPFRNMIMCHMIADTRRELDEMAKKLKLKPEWKQSVNNYGEHYDVALSIKQKAINLGAIEITLEECSNKCVARRGQEGMNKYLELNLGE